MKLPWLGSLEAAWLASKSQDRLPHAVMLLGAPGSGKRCAAAWMAATFLDLAAARDHAQFPLSRPEHADLRWISPPEDKHMIGIEQIRALVADLSLTSYAGNGKVAIIDPANAMTASAANSLLKTLEEPSGNALLILVADRTGRLPATIFSRCQKMTIPLPSESEALNWLHALQPATRWPAVLRGAGNAPLAALVAAERLQDTEIMVRDFTALSTRQAAPLEVAARWSKYEPEFVLNWLGRQVQHCILRPVAGLSAPSSAEVSDSVLQRIDRRNLFCYLDIINRLRGQPAGSFNVLLTLESLLIDWADGLRNCRKSNRAIGMQPLLGTE
jgi:DNA polymerase-3 subunit delta'